MRQAGISTRFPVTTPHIKFFLRFTPTLISLKGKDSLAAVIHLLAEGGVLIHSGVCTITSTVSGLRQKRFNILYGEAYKNVVHFFARPKKWTKVPLYGMARIVIFSGAKRAFVEIGTHDKTPPRIPEISVRKVGRKS